MIPKVEPLSPDPILEQSEIKYATVAKLAHVNWLIDQINQRVLPAYANYFDFSSASITSVVASNTWYKLNTSTVSGFSRDGLVVSNNRITNTGTKRIFKIEGIVSVSAGNNNEVHAAFFKNNFIHPCSEQSANTGPGNRVTALPFHCLIELDTNDFIEVWVKNSTHIQNITLGNINVIITEL
jgi:hypothetical protein